MAKNVSEINQTSDVMSLIVKPFEVYNGMNYSLSPIIKEWNQTHLIVNANFKHPLDISSGPVLD